VLIGLGNLKRIVDAPRWGKLFEKKKFLNACLEDYLAKTPDPTTTSYKAKDRVLVTKRGREFSGIVHGVGRTGNNTGRLNIKFPDAPEENGVK
jgi:hypothetical protein